LFTSHGRISKEARVEGGTTVHEVHTGKLHSGRLGRGTKLKHKKEPGWATLGANTNLKESGAKGGGKIHMQREPQKEES